MAIFTSVYFLGACSFLINDPTYCQNNTECSGTSRCVLGTCIAVECATTYDCPLEHVCAESNCVSGCSEDKDCLAGRSCIEGYCTEYGCRDTQLDCRIGERCIEGECTLLEPIPCSACTYADWLKEQDLASECMIQSFDVSIACNWRLDQGCPEDMSCYPADGEGLVEEGVCIQSYTLSVCVSDDDCPRGFYCSEDIYANGSGINVCWGDCAFYIGQGWL